MVFFKPETQETNTTSPQPTLEEKKDAIATLAKLAKDGDLQSLDENDGFSYDGKPVSLTVSEEGVMSFVSEEGRYKFDTKKSKFISDDFGVKEASFDEFSFSPELIRSLERAKAFSEMLGSVDMKDGVTATEAKAIVAFLKSMDDVSKSNDPYDIFEKAKGKLADSNFKTEAGIAAAAIVEKSMLEKVHKRAQKLATYTVALLEHKKEVAATQNTPLKNTTPPENDQNTGSDVLDNTTETIKINSGVNVDALKAQGYKIGEYGQLETPDSTDEKRKYVQVSDGSTGGFKILQVDKNLTNEGKEWLQKNGFWNNKSDTVTSSSDTVPTTSDTVTNDVENLSREDLKSKTLPRDQKVAYLRAHYSKQLEITDRYVQVKKADGTIDHAHDKMMPITDQVSVSDILNKLRPYFSTQETSSTGGQTNDRPPHTPPNNTESEPTGNAQTFAELPQYIQDAIAKSSGIANYEQGTYTVGKPFDLNGREYVQVSDSRGNFVVNAIMSSTPTQPDTITKPTTSIETGEYDRYERYLPKGTVDVAIMNAENSLKKSNFIDPRPYKALDAIKDALPIEKVRKDAQKIESDINRTFSDKGMTDKLPRARRVQRDIANGLKDAIGSAISAFDVKAYDRVVEEFVARYYHEQTGAIFSPKPIDPGLWVTMFPLKGKKGPKGPVRMASRKKARAMRKDIMNRLHSSIDTKNKFTGQEKILMRRFMSVIMGIRPTDPQKMKGKTPESIILDKMHNDPTQALTMDGDAWEVFLEQHGMKARRGSFLGAGVKHLPELTQAYIGSRENTNLLPGFRRFTELLRVNGGFERAYDALKDVADGVEQNLKLSRVQRFRKIDKTDHKALLVDFNLDGHVTYGDVSNQSGMQIKHLLDKYPQGLNNVIRAFNKGRKQKLRQEQIFNDVSHLTDLQNFVKKPPIPLNYMVRYGDEAIKKYLLAQQPRIEEIKYKIEQAKVVNETATAMSREFIAELNQKMYQMGGIDKLPPHEQKIAKALQNMPEEQLRTGIKSFLSHQIASFYAENPSVNASNGAVGAGIPLNKLVKGLSLGVSGGSGGLSLGFSRNKATDLGDGWKFNAGVDAGLALMSIPFASMSAGVAKIFPNRKQETSLDIRTRKTVGVSADASVSAATGLTWGLGAFIDASRARTIESQYNTLRSEVGGFGKKLIDGMMQDDGTILSSDADVYSYLRITYPDTKEETLKTAAKNIAKSLRYYDGMKFTDEQKVLFAKDFAEQFALSWKNDQSMEQHKKGNYVSGGGFGVKFFVGCIPVPVFLRIKNTKVTSFVDTEESLARMDAMRTEGIGNIEVNNIDELTKTLGLSADSFAEKGNRIYLSKKALKDANISLSVMEGTKIKDNGKEFVMYKNTPLRALSIVKGDGYIQRLTVGSTTESSDEMITHTVDTMQDGFEFADHLNEVEQKMFEEARNAIIQALNDTIIKGTADEGRTRKMIQHVQGLKFDDRVLTQDLAVVELKDGRYEQTWTPRPHDGSDFSLEVKLYGKPETVPGVEVTNETQGIIDDIYTEASKITSDGLRKAKFQKNIKGLYGQWRRYLKNANYEKAGEVMRDMLPRMQTYINEQKEKDTIDLTQFVDHLYDPQVLVAIDGLFSRVRSVRGTGEVHTYEIINGKTVGRIATENRRGILKKIKKETTSTHYKSYQKLFGVVSCYESKEREKITSVQKQNTIAYNFGNPDDPKRPVINPHVISSHSESLAGLEEKGLLSPTDIINLKTDIFTELIKNDSPLIEDLLGKIRGYGFKGSDNDLIDGFVNGSLDIGGETYTISYETSFELFAQCINHMIAISDLSITEPATTRTELKTHTKKIKDKLTGKMYTGIGTTTLEAQIGERSFDGAATGNIGDQPTTKAQPPGKDGTKGPPPPPGKDGTDGL